MDLAMRGVLLSVIQQLLGDDDPPTHLSTPRLMRRICPLRSRTLAFSETVQRAPAEHEDELGWSEGRVGEAELVQPVR
jgi:hypothetical protein